MKLMFTPKDYTVSYHGKFHKPGIPFEIDAQDREEMEKHGVVESPVPPPPVKPAAPTEGAADPPVRKGGRPKKVSE